MVEGGDKGLQVITKGYRGLQTVTKGYKVNKKLRGVKEGYKG